MKMKRRTKRSTMQRWERDMMFNGRLHMWNESNWNCTKTKIIKLAFFSPGTIRFRFKVLFLFCEECGHSYFLAIASAMLHTLEQYRSSRSHLYERERNTYKCVFISTNQRCYSYKFRQNEKCFQCLNTLHTYTHTFAATVRYMCVLLAHIEHAV